MMSIRNSNSDILQGKTILVTGATDGIGKQTALQLAGMGARVLLHDNDRQRLENTRRQIHRMTGRDNLGLYQADLSKFVEVKTMVQELLAQEAKLDVLVNNAGVYNPKPSLSVDGYELTFAINHLGHFLLALLLLDKLKTSAPARIVVVASTEHSTRDINYENLRTIRSYEGWSVYRRSKLANILFTYYLADLMRGSGVTVNCLHPGVVDTKLLRSAFPHLKGIRVEEGAATSVYLASSLEVSGVTGKYFDQQKPTSYNPITYDKQAQQRLWSFSQKVMVDLGYLDDHT
jgi:NAD(P)-dependent dehydrogenase (short-subunit alcohol dehydrogenase family)